MKTMKEIFSVNLRDQLYLKRMSQSELAKKLDVTEASVSKWVQGSSIPRAKKMDEICRVLKCSIDDLTIDHTKIVELAPEDVMAEELRENTRLFKLLFYASKLSDAELDDLIERARK